MFRRCFPLLLLTLLPLAALAARPTSLPPGLQRPATHQEPQRLELSALDLKRIVAQDQAAREKGKPPRYAVTRKVSAVTPQTAGDWETLADGRRVWRYAVHAEGATSVQPVFSDFFLPKGATLYVYSGDGTRVRGPYTAKDDHDYRQLWVPVVEGDTAIIELVLNPGVAPDHVALSMDRVLQGYWRFWERYGWADTLAKVDAQKSGSCNVDVACNQAAGWGDQIDAVARITITSGGGTFLCSGQLVNDTAYDQRPLFLTAHHCLLREDNSPSATVYWNFENSACRTPGSTASGQTGDGSLDDTTEGAHFLATYPSSDFTLVELAEPPDPSFDVYWAGWDRRDMTFPGGVAIHHPEGDEKRISFENDPLVIIDGSDIAGTLEEGSARPRSHLQVSDWDVGTTEHGSSGGGLFEPTHHRLVGQLTGGLAACGNNDPDWFGRIWMSWDGGGTADSRLRDYLDPLDTGAKTLDGTRGCAVGANGISISPAHPKIGETVTLSATGTGLNGLEYAWDADGDGLPDGHGKSLQVSYPAAFSGNVRLSAHKPDSACGQNFSKALQVTGPELELANVGEPFQVAGAANGDGDGVMEPGERWAVRVTLRNAGDSRATGVQAVFVPPGGGHAGGPDNQGYTYGDSQGGGCIYRYESIAGSGNGVTFNPSSSTSGIPGNDDGGTDPIALSNFSFYGQALNSVVMSSNGYLATSATRDGGDYTNDCPLPPAVLDIDSGANNNGRLAALHDDLVTGNGWSRRFANCPRPPDTAGATGACRVFQWSNVRQYRGTSRFDFQALLYEGSNEIVYQYGPELAVDELSPTVGIHDQSLSTGLTYACEDGSSHAGLGVPIPGTAVCFYDAAHKANLTDAVHLLTPALAYDDIPAGGNQTSTLEFEIDQDAPCGSQFQVALHGAVFDGGFYAGPGSIFTGQVGGADGVCDTVIKSGADKAAEIDFRPGNYFNPGRVGHGVDIHRSGPNAFMLWFTYGKGRTPVWYLASGPYADNQLHGDLLRFTLDPDAAFTPNKSCTQAGANPTCEVVGEAIFTFTGPQQGVFNWTLDNVPGGEPFQFLSVGPDSTPVNHTGHWYPPSQSGWGMTFNDQGSTEIGIVYFYDENGDPVWALGSTGGAGTSSQVQVPLDQFTGVCPGCVWAAQQARHAGSLSRQFSGASDGTVSTNIGLLYPRAGDWDKNNVPVKILSDPAN